MSNIVSSTFRRVVAFALTLGLTGFECAQGLTWNGGGSDDNWSTADNWGGTAPTGGEALAFGGTTRCTNVNNLAADTSISGITFNSDAGKFLISGNRITLDGNVAGNATVTGQSIGLDLVLNATRTFNMASGSVYLLGNISGAGGITKTGSNYLLLFGDNTYEGPTTISDGIIRITGDRALGTADGGTVVASGKRLELAGVCVTGEVASITGNGGNNFGALQAFSGSNTWAGRIILGDSNSRLGTFDPNATLVIAGPIEDGSSTWPLVIRNADNGGPTVLTSPDNTYKGDTKLIVGLLRLSGGDNRLPTGTVVRLGNSSNLGIATLDLNGCNQEVAGLTQDGTTMQMKVANLNSNQLATLTVNQSAAFTFSGVLDGNMNLVKKGTGKLTLSSGGNPFTGETDILDGQVLAQGPWVLKDSTYNTGSGPMGVLALGTNTQMSFGGLIGTNDLVMTNSAGGPVSLRIRGAQSTGFDGQVVGGCDFTKIGSGTFTLYKGASYTGTTYIAGGRLVVPTEDVLGVYPSDFVANRITFDGGTLKAATNFVFGASNRGVTLAAGGGTFEESDADAIFTVSKTLVGPGGLGKTGDGVVALAVSNAYEGVTTVSSSILRLLNSHSLGSAAGSSIVMAGGQLELANGLTVSGESVTISGAGITVGNTPDSAPQFNRGALQAGTNAAAEWAGPLILASGESRVGAQNGGTLTISGPISGAAGTNLRTSTDPSDRVRGVILSGVNNTYAGNTEVTRGTLFLGATDTLPVASTLNVHWASANNTEYAALDLNGFDQTVGGLMNAGVSGANAVVTNSSPTASTLTVNQAGTTDFNGFLAGTFSLVKSGAGTLSLSYANAYSGTTTVSGGTLALAVNGALPSGTDVILAGGTLDMGGYTNAVASLSLTASSVLALGGGSLTFSAQSAEAWTGLLSLTGALDTAKLRFLPALSADQLASIRYEGKRVYQNSAGYITRYRGTLLRVM